LLKFYAKSLVATPSKAHEQEPLPSMAFIANDAHDGLAAMK